MFCCRTFEGEGYPALLMPWAPALEFRKPRKIDLQPLFDEVVGRFKGERGKMMTQKGRLALINNIVRTTYFLTVFPSEKNDQEV